MRILLAIDNSECSDAVTDHVITEFRHSEAEVGVVSVVDTTKLVPATDGHEIHTMYLEEVATILEEWRNEAKTTLASAVRKLLKAGFAAHSTLLEGEAKACLLDYADKWKPDLIVVGSHSRKGVDRLLHGSVSEAILRHARCSVRVVRVGTQSEKSPSQWIEERDVAHTQEVGAGRS